MLFYQHERMWRDDIETKASKRRRKADRKRRKDAGEPVSDSSSVKEAKQKKKDKYLNELKKTMITTQEEIDN